MDANNRRPLRLLVSTSASHDRAGTLGHADYSYGFVLDAFAPVLDRIAPWTRLNRAESRLLPLTQQALDAGERPIHLAFAPLHKVYLTPAVPTIVFPFWEFPEIPDRPFGTDTRQDWSRIAAHVSGFVASCSMTARSFAAHVPSVPIATVPVPLRDACFEHAAWRPDRIEMLTCKYLEFLGESAAMAADASPVAVSRRLRFARGLKGIYARHVWPKMSTGQRAFVHRVARGMIPSRRAVHAALERRDLALGGLVFTSTFNFLDDRKNARDILTAFLLEFAEQSDATLVLKLTSCPRTEAEIVSRLRAMYSTLGVSHRCRVVAILDYLDDAAMDRLMSATTAYVNASHAEGACLPLQQAMAAGRPVVAPAHTSMADYIDGDVGAVVASSGEPTHWPHDPERRIATTWQRIDWMSLRNGMREIGRAARDEGSTYELWSRTARERMRQFAGANEIESRLRGLIQQVAARSTWGAFDWQSAQRGAKEHRELAA